MSHALTASGRWSNPVGWVCLAVNLLWMLNLQVGSNGDVAVRGDCAAGVEFDVSVICYLAGVWPLSGRRRRRDNPPPRSPRAPVAARPGWASP